MFEPQPPAVQAEAVNLGMVLGENLALGLVSGRCSAAQAERLIHLRENKLYLGFAPSWKDFCPRYLGMSSAHADRIIRCWQEFGPGFFELRQFVRMSAEFYRSIEPAVKDGAIHFNDEAIEIDPENAQKIQSAVAELRRAAPPKEPSPPLTLQDRLVQLDKHCDQIVSEFNAISRLKCQGKDFERFEIVLNRISAALQNLEVDNGIF
jgi:hypothetical protein